VNIAMIPAEVQPQLPPSVRASRRQTSATERSSAPTTSIRERIRAGDSGTNRWIASVDSPMTTAPTAKSHRHESWSMRTPEATSPIPPPTPKDADTSPIPSPTRWGGNSSRMIANPSGKTAAPAPCRARQRMSDHRSHAKTAATEPARKTRKERTSTRSFPNWSPSRPRIGVAIADTRRTMVTSHAVHAAVVPNSRCRCGRAGTTIVFWKLKATPAAVSAAIVIP
jgi:hypothetical protein